MNLPRIIKRTVSAWIATVWTSVSSAIPTGCKGCALNWPDRAPDGMRHKSGIAGPRTSKRARLAS